MNEKPDDITIKIATFLSRLGLAYTDNVNEKSYWEKCWQDIRDAGGNPEKTLADSNPMSRAIVNMYFMTRKIACKFLTADIPRLHHTLETIENMDLIPSSASNIAEIGGGPGIVSLWLAKKNPGIKFTVYDYAENPLKIGKKWARDLGIKNISYERKSYNKLSTEKIREKFDLVIALSIIDLKIEQADNKAHLSIIENGDYKEDKKLEMLQDFAEAVANMLKPGGISYFSQGNFNDLGLFNLFKSFRENKLGMDWEKTRALVEGEGPSFSFKEIHIFTQKNLPSVFKNAIEDTQTFLFRGTINNFDKKTILGYSDFETYLDLLSSGTKLVEINAERDDQIVEKYLIYVKSGMLGFFSSNSKGGRSGFIYSAASFLSSCNKLESIIDSYKSRNIKIINEYWHPFFGK